MASPVLKDGYDETLVKVSLALRSCLLHFIQSLFLTGIFWLFLFAIYFKYEFVIEDIFQPNKTTYFDSIIYYSLHILFYRVRKVEADI